MANQASIYIIFKRDKLPHDVNSIVGASVSYTDYSGGNNSLGTVAAVQTISELAAATTKTGSDIYKGANLISGLASEVYVFIKIKDIVWDNKELTTLGNGLDLADLNTLISGGVTLAGLFIGSAVIETAGLILAPLGGALYLYNSDVNHEKITGEKIYYRYEKTAMFGFTNDLWDTVDLNTYESMNIGLGGAQILRWVISAIEDFKPVSPEHRFITGIYSNNYKDMALDYIYGEKTYAGNAGLRTPTGDVILRDYQIKFIDRFPDALLEQLKIWEANGEADKVSAYIHALEQINPVVVINPKKPIVAKTIDDAGEDWIKLRTWMVWEYMLNRAIDYHEDKNEKLGLRTCS